MELFQPIPYAGWADTLATVHRVAQVVGRVRLPASPRRNHWWNVPFHLTGRGITTRPMGLDPTFTIDLDLLDHRLDVSTVEGRWVSSSLLGRSVADVHVSPVAFYEAACTAGATRAGWDVAGPACTNGVTDPLR